MCWRFREGSEVCGFFGCQVFDGFPEIRHGRISHTEAGLAQKYLVRVLIYDFIMRKSFANHKRKRDILQPS
jgi:hypothetical protein